MRKLRVRKLRSDLPGHSTSKCQSPKLQSSHINLLFIISVSQLAVPRNYPGRDACSQNKDEKMINKMISALIHILTQEIILSRVDL